MFYYSFHVGDYIHDTAHLSNDEDLAFRRLLDLYYTQEQPIPNKTQEVSRRIRMAKLADVVQTVLEEFFVLDVANDCWRHKRCDETIAAYQAKAERNRTVGKLGGRPKSNPNANPQETQMVSKDNPNHKPITNNHKLIKEIQAAKAATPVGVSQSVWDDFVKHRKALKAQISMTAITRIEQEAAKAGWTLEQALTECVAQGWRGFKAEWVAVKQNTNNLTKTGQMNQTVMSGLTRGLIGGGKNVKLLGI
jgi:uncharacterized protein YdaU (DUF1376 family)